MWAPFSTFLISLCFLPIFPSYLGSFTVRGPSFPQDFFGVWIMAVAVGKWITGRKSDDETLRSLRLEIRITEAL